MSVKDSTPISIIRQGAPLVDVERAGHALLAGGGAAVFFVELISRHCITSGTSQTSHGVPTITLSADDDSTHLALGCPRSIMTEIAFPDFSGWEVHALRQAGTMLAVALRDRRQAFTGKGEDDR